MIAGRDYIGVGVGAMVFNRDGRVFLSQRGPRAKNERGCWEFPGGSVEWGEPLTAAIKREFKEEYELEIEVVELLAVFDHILGEERQHWVSPTFIARYVAGTPRILEPDKCAAIGWFELSTLPEPLSQVSINDARVYLSKYSPSRRW
jgi:8-oxo-dGTP diphosphatase